jgi:hypothetical protein
LYAKAGADGMTMSKASKIAIAASTPAGLRDLGAALSDVLVFVGRQ